MALQVDDGQHAGFGLEPQHALVGRLVLPGAGTHQRRPAEIKAFVTVNVAGHENVGHLANHQTVFGFGRKGRLPTPLRRQMTTSQHLPHRFDGVGVGDGSKASDEVVDGFPVVGQQPHAVKREIAGVSNKGTDESSSSEVSDTTLQVVALIVLALVLLAFLRVRGHEPDEDDPWN